MLIALALPLAGVILTLQSVTKAGEAQAPQESESGVSDALKSMLEGIADEKLAPEELRNGDARIELTTDELNGDKVRIEGLLKSYGGVLFRRSKARLRLDSLSKSLRSILRSFWFPCAMGRRGDRSKMPLAVF